MLVSWPEKHFASRYFLVLFFYLKERPAFRFNFFSRHWKSRPGEYHLCPYSIFWPWQIGFLLQEQVNIRRTVNDSLVIFWAFPYLMQQCDGLENIRKFNKTSFTINFRSIFVILLPFAAFDGISGSERHKYSAEKTRTTTTTTTTTTKTITITIKLSEAHPSRLH